MSLLTFGQRFVLFDGLFSAANELKTDNFSKITKILPKIRLKFYIRGSGTIGR